MSEETLDRGNTLRYCFSPLICCRHRMHELRTVLKTTSWGLLAYIPLLRMPFHRQNILNHCQRYLLASFLVETHSAIDQVQNLMKVVHMELSWELHFHPAAFSWLFSRASGLQRKVFLSFSFCKHFSSFFQTFWTKIPLLESYLSFS